VEVLKRHVCAAGEVADWLFDESLKAVGGDRIETIALLWPAAAAAPSEPDRAMPHRPEAAAEAAKAAEAAAVSLAAAHRLLAALPRRTTAAAARAIVGGTAIPAPLLAMADALDADARRVLLALACGRFRSPLSLSLLVIAVAEQAGVPVAWVALRLPNWIALAPDERRWAGLLAPPGPAEAAALPAPWTPQIEPDAAVAQLGSVNGLPEKVIALHDGPRGQIVVAEGHAWCWRDGGARVTAIAHPGWPDGSIVEGVCGDEGGRDGAGEWAIDRIHRWAGFDEPPSEAAECLPAVVADGDFAVRAAVSLNPGSAADLADLLRGARARGWAGLRLREIRPDSVVDHLWRAPPLGLDAVLIQARPAADGSAGYDPGFAVWNRRPRDEAEVLEVVAAISEGRAPLEGALQLVIVAWIAVGPDHALREAVAAAVRTATVGRFGPLRVLAPSRVARIAFDALRPNARRKCGWAVVAPRVAGPLSASTIAEAATLPDLCALGSPNGPSSS
jgi:DNA ligase-1